MHKLLNIAHEFTDGRVDRWDKQCIINGCPAYPVLALSEFTRLFVFTTYPLQ